MLFTTWTKDVKTQLDLVIGNQHISTVTRPKILGVTFDNMLTFCPHGKTVKNNMQAKTNILKSLAGSKPEASKQYSLTFHLPDHPSYSLVNERTPERNLRKYAAREYKENIESFIP